MPERRFSQQTPLKIYRRAILVGASSGIGAELAQKLADEGYLLALLGRRSELLEALCVTINQKHGETRALAFAHDVRDPQAVADLFAEIVKTLGGLDVLIYNAGILQTVRLDEFNLEKDLEMTRINYLGALAWLNPAAAYFQGLKSGQIVGLGSVAGDRGRVGAPAYNASKAALQTYLEALRNRLTRHGVNVLTIKPGFVATDMIKDNPRTPMVISAEQAALGIWRAMQSRKQTVYIPGQWGLLMHIIRHIPSVIFRRLTF
ncbi:MAG: SDR family NAD(P)-dependent oxidoreductase [Anaerolineales bacterium]|nr:SDR family NAD(P)-dependent oxidoreductase [Anaerolineales bacterium]